MSIMPEISLDGSRWRTREDFYKDLLPALDAPAWHGHNLDALNDTIAGGDVNGVNPPFAVRIGGRGALPPDLHAYVESFMELMADLQARGVPVEATWIDEG